MIDVVLEETKTWIELKIKFDLTNSGSNVVFQEFYKNWLTKCSIWWKNFIFDHIPDNQFVLNFHIIKILQLNIDLVK